MSNLQLEVGNRYKNGEGAEVLIIADDISNPYITPDSRFEGVTEDGGVVDTTLLTGHLIVLKRGPKKTL